MILIPVGQAFVLKRLHPECVAHILCFHVAGFTLKIGSCRAEKEKRYGYGARAAELNQLYLQPIFSTGTLRRGAISLMCISSDMSEV
ncbi:hypothetical protein DLM45_10925 [Hyphomicrobium methylovorum]|nr:hypothetical protein [Hyphomicrobium methylovorum]